jgi:hypothetical protein
LRGFFLGRSLGELGPQGFEACAQRSFLGAQGSIALRARLFSLHARFKALRAKPKSLARKHQKLAAKALTVARKAKIFGVQGK